MISFDKIGMMCLFLAAPVWAQNLISVKAGLINFAEGNVYVEERRLQFSENTPPILKVEERLSTGFGWVEIQLGPGAYLRMGTGGLLKMENSDLDNMQFRISRGSVMVEIFDEVDDNNILIHFRDAAIELKEKGLYRLDCSLSRLRVYGGKAEMRQSLQKTTVKRGEAAVRGNKKVSEFDTEEKDLLHQWAALRSFVLYMMNEDTRRRWTHWIPLNGGWLQNDLYGVQAYSQIAQEEQGRKLNIELAKRAQQAQQQMKILNMQNNVLIRLQRAAPAVNKTE